tara:strand:+ start:347 stop:724 length:378 start_codon:yes stop_codon:yes gene_type:complete
MSIIQYQFDNEAIINGESIPFLIRTVDNKTFFYVYAYGCNRFQCREKRTSISQEESDLLFSVSQRDKIYGTYYAKFLRHFDIGDKRFYLMKFFFKNGVKRWQNWAIPREFSKRINWITFDYDDRS